VDVARAWIHATKELPMRAIDCICGQHLEAETDEQLMPMVLEHVKEKHPEIAALPQEQLQQLYNDRVRTV
jgi:predicted small metal-binding protein